jgi:hypothetical protein
LTAVLATAGVLATGVSLLAQQDGRGGGAADPFQQAPEAAPMIQKTYRVADLVGTKARADGNATQVDMSPLIEIIATTVTPGEWHILDQNGQARIPGGRRGEREPNIPTIIPFNLSVSLIVRHTEQGHAQVAERLDQLRRLAAAKRGNEGEAPPEIEEAKKLGLPGGAGAPGMMGGMMGMMGRGSMSGSGAAGMMGSGAQPGAATGPPAGMPGGSGSGSMTMRGSGVAGAPGASGLSGAMMGGMPGMAAGGKPSAASSLQPGGGMSAGSAEGGGAATSSSFQPAGGTMAGMMGMMGGPARAGGAAAASREAETERRLRSLEEKLDRVLKALDVPKGGASEPSRDAQRR